MRGDGWDQLIFDDWDDYADYCEAAHFGKMPKVQGREVIIGGLPYGADGKRM